MKSPSRRLPVILGFGLAAIAVALLVVYSGREGRAHDESQDSGDHGGPDLATRFVRLEAREREVDETTWAAEMLAQECGRTMESLWDSLNAATNKLAVLADFPVGEVVPGERAAPSMVGDGIQLYVPSGAGSALSPEEWRDLVGKFAREGWQLAQTEFRHHRFETNLAGRPRQSGFRFSGHLNNPARNERAIVEGDLVVDWAPGQPGPELPTIVRIDASRLTIKTRSGEPPFRPILSEEIASPEKSNVIDPLIICDLDGDGLSEIILAGKNVVYRRRGADHYQPEPFCRHPVEAIQTALIADFDGDGNPDFLCARFGGLDLLRGSAQGKFDEPARPAWTARPQLSNGQFLAGGDVDGDGDLDVFLGQYKSPYDFGQMPTPYYDANDGDRSYLLLNDGRGNFIDATDDAGLASKRRRRCYSGSLVDLDGNGHLDLLVVSDFAGLDLYRNDGRGRFTEVTREWVVESHAFGMSHALADFNGDGRIDLLMIGMNSPTADRLESLGLWRSDVTEDRSMRARMSAGNRLYLSRPGGGFEEASSGGAIRRSGWSWGCSTFDFDNDGFPDVYVANGHETGPSVRDYEREFWLHDVFVGSSTNDIVAGTYFQAKSARTRGRGESFGGHEKNRLYLNRGGETFIEAGHLMGVALAEDSRAVVADDLDGDGRIDLLLTTFESWPAAKQTLRIYRNAREGGGNWIGFRFREEGPGKSPVGVQVTLRRTGASSVRQIVTGDSYRAQHSNTVHFGLGEAERVDSVEVRWPGGRKLTLRQPEVNRYHSIRFPADDAIEP